MEWPHADMGVAHTPGDGTRRTGSTHVGLRWRDAAVRVRPLSPVAFRLGILFAYLGAWSLLLWFWIHGAAA